MPNRYRFTVGEIEHSGDVANTIMQIRVALPGAEVRCERANYDEETAVMIVETDLACGAMFERLQESDVCI